MGHHGSVEMVAKLWARNVATLMLFCQASVGDLRVQLLVPEVICHPTLQRP